MKQFALLLALFTTLVVHGADKKVTDLTLLPAASFATGDVVPIVDVSAGETKKTRVLDFDTRYMVTPYTTAGDTSYFNGSAPARVAIGAVNTVNVSTGSAPSWAKILDANLDTAAAISFSKMAALTASRVAITDVSGVLSAADTATYPNLTELSYIKGVTSAAQTQLNTLTSNVALKAPLASPTFSGTITTPLTASRALVTGASSELAVATTTATEIGFVNGVTSSLCGINQACTATNKTFTAPNINAANLNFGTASNTNRLLLPNDTTTNLALLTSTAGLFAYDTTQAKPVFNNGAGWTVVGSGSGSGGTNFILNPDAESGLTGWSTYADSAATTPVDCTGGSPSSTWTQSSSSPLAGTYSFLWSKSAANRQGEGVSYAFAIDSSAQAKVLSIDFDTIVASGTYVAGASGVDSDQEIYIYDVTNSTLIQPTTYKVYSNSSTVAIHYTANFQSASNSTSYRLCVHTATTSASAYTTRFDGFKVAPSTYTYGTPITDWVNYGSTATFGAGYTSTTNKNLFWRRVGGSIEIQASFTTTTVSGSASTISLPSGLTVDSTLVPVRRVVGYGSSSTTGSALRFALALGGDTTFCFGVQGTSGLSCSNASAVFNAGDVNAFETISIPITGWTSPVQMSDSTPQAEVTAIVSGDPASATVGNPIIVPTVGKDTMGGYSASTGRYTVPFPGRYKLFGALQSASSATTLTIYKNAVSTQLAGNLDSNGEATFNGMVDAVAGDLLDIRPGGTVDATSMSLNIERVGSSVSIGATEPVAFTAYRTPAQTGINTNASAVKLTYNTVATGADTHGAFDTSNNRYVVPIAGRYCFDAGVGIAATNTLAVSHYLEFRKNGSVLKYFAHKTPSGAGIAFSLNGSLCNIQAVAGDYFEVFIFGNGNNSVSTIGMDAGGINSAYFSGYRIGL